MANFLPERIDLFSFCTWADIVRLWAARIWIRAERNATRTRNPASRLVTQFPASMYTALRKWRQEIQAHWYRHPKAVASALGGGQSVRDWRHFPYPQICSHTLRLIGLGLWHLGSMCSLGGVNATHFCIMHCWPESTFQQAVIDVLDIHLTTNPFEGQTWQQKLSCLNKRPYREGVPCTRSGGGNSGATDYRVTGASAP